MQIKDSNELKILREGGKRLAEVLCLVSEKAKPGISTKELDEFAEKMIVDAGGIPSFKNYPSPEGGNPYPATLCVSVNDEIVHGIPSDDRVLRDGDMWSFDIGMEWRGLYTDTALTVPVGNVDKEGLRLIMVTREALARGIKVAKEGAHIGDMGHAVQSYAESEGFSVVRELVGHGVGRAVHEEPEVPNWGKSGHGLMLREGMVLALEPMITEGSPVIKLASDRWTWKTTDGKRAAHFEHTIVVRKGGAEIITQ